MTERVAAFLDALDDGAALLVGDRCEAREEGEFVYCASPDLHWLLGWEKGAIAALFRPGAEQPVVVFVEPRHRWRESVDGPCVGVDEARARWGTAFPLDELDERLGELCLGYPTLHHDYGRDPEMDRRVFRSLRAARPLAARNGLEAPRRVSDPGPLLAELRSRKSAEELDILRRASAISTEAHVLAMRHGRDGTREYEIEALVNATFRRRGGDGPGYATIVGAGPNACVLHYAANRDVLRAGQLCLVDAGCRLSNYTTDVTRTWPIDGRYSGPQRALYEVVLSAWRAAVAEVRAGRPWHGLHDAALRALCTGLVDLGLLAGDVDELVHDEAYRRFYRHEIGHWLGLEVHDAGEYHRVGRSRLLEVGQVLAIEPGLYVAEDDGEAPPAFRGLGVRIEDDLVVTDGDPEILTDACPRELEDVERACGRPEAGDRRL